MRNKFLAAVIAAFASSVGAQTPVPTPTITVDRIVAVVGDQPLLWSDVLAYINQQRASGVAIPPDSLGQLAFARDALNQLIDEEILVQKAHEMKVDVTEGEVNRSVDDQLKRIRDQFKSEDEYRTELKNAGFGTPDEYRRTLYTQFYRRALQQRVFPDLQKTARLKNVSDAEIDEAFQKNRGMLKSQPATVTFRQIVVAPKPTAAQKKIALAKAESLLVEIRNGGDFEQIAKRESMDPGSKPTGGDLGWNRRGTMVPEFERMMFLLGPGQISPVVETPFGYHIIRVDRVQAGEVHVHHILITPVIDSADIAAALLEADSVAKAWRAGASFDSLVAKHHDPAEEKGILQPFVRDSLPASYGAALSGKKAGDVTDPFELAGTRGTPKYSVIQLVTVNEAGQFVESEVRERIRQQLVAERATRQLLDDLRKKTYVAIRL